MQIGCNSVVNKTFTDDDILLVGMPAVIKKNVTPWYVGWEAEQWHDKIEKLRVALNLDISD